MSFFIQMLTNRAQNDTGGRPHIGTNCEFPASKYGEGHHCCSGKTAKTSGQFSKPSKTSDSSQLLEADDQ